MEEEINMPKITGLGDHAANEQKAESMDVKAVNTEVSTDAAVSSHIRFPSCRLILAVMGFFAFVNCHTFRMALNVAIVEMVNTTYLRDLEATTELLNSTDATNSTVESDDLCAADQNASNVVSHSSDGIFNWDTKTQGLILGAFYYGYMATQIIGGIIAQKIGGKLPMLIGGFGPAVLTLLTPIFTTVGGFGAIFTIRLLEGICEGVTPPSMSTLLSEWAPPLERSRMGTFVFAGLQIGSVIGMAVSGILCQYLGWQSPFYVFGAAGVVWTIIFYFLVYNSPATHPRISAQERQYIEKALNKKSKQKGSVRAPWLSFVKSLPLYALTVAHVSFNWGYYTLMSCLPQYFKHILHFDVQSNGLVSAAPFVFMWIMNVIGGIVADLLQKKKLLSTTNVRKLANALGFMLPAICLIATGYVNCNASVAVFLIIFAVGSSGIAFAGYLVNHIDLAPPYAGTLMGITNTLATLPGIVGPAAVGIITYRNQTREAWRAVFYIAASVYAFGTIFYGLFGSGQLQSWAIPPKSPVLQDPEVEVAESAVEEQRNK